MKLWETLRLTATWFSFIGSIRKVPFFSPPGVLLSTRGQRLVAAVQETYDLLETLNRHTANTGTLYFLKQQGGTFVAVFIIVAESRYLNCVVWDQCKLSYSVFVVLFIGKSCFSCSIVEQPHICTSRWETLVYFMAVTVITYFLLL